MGRREHYSFEHFSFLAVNRYLDVNEVPPGGWKYEQPDTGAVFTATTLLQLIRKVATYRASNRLEMGDVEADVHEFICKTLPPNARVRCQQQGVVAGSDRTRKWSVADVNSYTKTVIETMRAGGTCSVEEANRRARICRDCPLNRDIRPCASCGSKLALLPFKLMGATKTDFDADLKSCDICGCYNKAKVWIPESRVAAERTMHNYPSHCWLH